MSLVGYVELREGYADFLKDIRLKSQLVSLENLGIGRGGGREGAGTDELAEIRTALQGTD